MLAAIMLLHKFHFMIFRTIICTINKSRGQLRERQPHASGGSSNNDRNSSSSSICNSSSSSSST